MERYIRAADRSDGLIGIWWYDELSDAVSGVAEPVDDGVIDGDFIQYHKGNYMTFWKSNAPEGMYEKGFKSMYRGRVIYNTRTQCYEITCSEFLISNELFRKSIISYFQLSECRREFVPLNHYRSKVELTGNPSVDALYFDF